MSALAEHTLSFPCDERAPSAAIAAVHTFAQSNALAIEIQRKSELIVEELVT
ncbi:MAG: hypothetical protein ACI9W2_004730, partial [Gammaproteobacteria bacterium]